MLVKAGAVLAALTAVIHVFIGGYDTLSPLLTYDIDPVVSGTFHACWHIISVFLAYSAWVFWSGRLAAVHFAILWGAFAVIFVVVGLWQLGVGGLLVMPQWILLGPAGALVLAGTYARTSKPTAG